MKTTHTSTNSVKLFLFSCCLLLTTSLFSQLNMDLIASLEDDYAGLEIEKPVSPKIQVVFALDVTGSMGGLITAAKEKIWSIATSLAQAENSPEISMGIVAYRDRGDAFVTQVIELDTDIDHVYGQLMKLSAGGGGDTPESVNRALYDAINTIQWDKSQSTMKTVFLVGDCPPHMDYADDVKYPETCKKANKEDIVINTLLMGGSQATAPVWREIASLGRGEFFEVGMDAGVIAVATPYDEIIKEKSKTLEKSKTYVGTKEYRAEQEEKTTITLDNVSTSSAGSAARRATFNNTESGMSSYYDSNELINLAQSDDFDLDKIDESSLPEVMQDMDDDEREEYLETKVIERVEIQNEIDTLIKEREKFILEETAVSSDKDSFTFKVFNSLKNQAKKKEINMKSAPSY